ncbi:hypothetical protein KJS94_09715 [Flavihumibacter rivuli]|uniref:hypothetical protein n=1 Tax=Flavihumibacter rivuli TaxID=2838156 RepID=UPI001BDF248A|nr:hypothetical protein [Flavihumibacter rivuli]ULQ54914.1 hypothetical protein KJS94_09715 [Flavihumibacter rivuli]
MPDVYLSYYSSGSPAGDPAGVWECGYHDYQHLAKDYREFANGSPNDFFREESKAPERVLGLNG